MWACVIFVYLCVDLLLLHTLGRLSNCQRIVIVSQFHPTKHHTVPNPVCAQCELWHFTSLTHKQTNQHTQRGTQHSVYIYAYYVHVYMCTGDWYSTLNKCDRKSSATTTLHTALNNFGADKQQKQIVSAAAVPKVKTKTPIVYHYHIGIAMHFSAWHFHKTDTVDFETQNRSREKEEEEAKTIWIAIDSYVAFACICLSMLVCVRACVCICTLICDRNFLFEHNTKIGYCMWVYKIVSSLVRVT